MRRKGSGPRIFPVHSDVAGAETRLRKLRAGFRRVSHRWNRRRLIRTCYETVRLPVIVAIGSFAVSWYFLSSPWPMDLTLRHLGAFLNCDAAEAVGLAPARRGQPG
jgi:hypothetical protein